MKKFLLLLFCLNSISFVMFSQSKTLMNEGFESGDKLPEGWKSIKNNDWNYWLIDTIGANGSSQCATVPYSYNLNNWLITPQLAPSASNYQFTFWFQVSEVYSYADDVMDIKVSTSNGTVSTFKTEPLLTFNMTGNSSDTIAFSNTWTQYTIDLSAYIGDAIFIGFNAKGGYLKPNLDDVSGIPYAEFDNDISVDSLNIEDVFYFENDNVKLEAVITNAGNLAQTTSTLSFKVDGEEFASESLNLEAGITSAIEKIWNATIGNHEITAVVSSDDNTINDSIFESIMVYPKDALVESFEGYVFPPLNWTNEGNKWGNISWNQYHGANSATVFGGNKKLVTPKLNITNNDSIYFHANAGNDFVVLTSDNYIHWDTVAYFTGNYAWQEYKVYFNNEVNAGSIGKQYIAFETLGEYSGMDLDMVVGPKVAVVSDDFEMLTLTKLGADIPHAGNNIDFEVVIKNNMVTSASKYVYLTSNGDTLDFKLSQVIGENELDTIILSWIPDKGYPSITLSANLSADDIDGNNSISLATNFYPAEPVSANIYSNFDSSPTLPDYWLSDNVEDATWTITSPFSEGGSLYSPECKPYSGNSVLAFNTTWSANGIKLVSPWLNLSYNTYKVSFYLFRDDSDWNLQNGDSILVRTNSKPDTTGSIIAGSVARSIAMTPVVDSAGWYYYEYLLDCSEISDGFIIFEGVSSGSYANIYIDNLEIKAYPPYDAAITSIVKLDQVIWGNPVASNDVNVILKNTGENALTSATINWSVDGVTQTEYAWEGNLAMDSIAQINIAEGFAFAVNDSLNIKAWVTIPDDGNAKNDTAESILITKLAYELAYENSFEADTLVFENWLQIDADGDGKNWGISTGNPNTGLQHLSSASYDSVNSGALTPDNWLITPGYIIKHNKFYVSFYVGAENESYYEENFDVLISTEGTDTSKFVSVHSETLTSNAYKQVIVELKDYQEKTIHIA